MCDIFKYELVDGWFYLYDVLKLLIKYLIILCVY